MDTLRRMLPSTNALFVFEAAARGESFTRAAAELNVTQPAVSRMLARLEGHLGVRLFERSASGALLTEDGRILYRRIAEGFRGIEAALREIDARRTGIETVTLSLSSAFTTHWLMPRIDKLQTAFPAVDFQFQLIAGPLRGPVDSVDLGMRFVDGDDIDHETAFVMNEVTLPVCSPGYLARRAAGSPGFREVFVQLSESSTHWIHQFAPQSGGRDEQPVSFSFPDYAIVVQAALLGQGIGLGWLTVVGHWLRIGDLVPAARPVRTGRLCQLVHRRNRPMRRAVADARDWIIAELRADIAEIDRIHPDLEVGRLCY